MVDFETLGISADDQLRYVTETFGLSADEIDSNALASLYSIARAWRQAGYPDPRARLHEPMLHDLFAPKLSLYEVLTDRPDAGAVDLIGLRMANDND